MTEQQRLFLQKYSENYKFLYDNNDRVAGYEEARDFFDKAMKGSPSFKKLVQQMVAARGDFFSSDRECAAFAFACSDLGLI